MTACSALVPRATAVLAAGLVEDRCADIDVGGLHGAYLKQFRQAGGTLETDFRVERLRAGRGRVASCGR